MVKNLQMIVFAVVCGIEASFKLWKVWAGFGLLNLLVCPISDIIKALCCLD